MTITDADRALRQIAAVLRPGVTLSLSFTFTTTGEWTATLTADTAVHHETVRHRFPSAALGDLVAWLNGPENTADVEALVLPGRTLPADLSPLGSETSRMVRAASMSAPCSFRLANGAVMAGTLVFWPIPADELSPRHRARLNGKTSMARARVADGRVMSFPPSDLITVEHGDARDRKATA